MLAIFAWVCLVSLASPASVVRADVLTDSNSPELLASASDGGLSQIARVSADATLFQATADAVALEASQFVELTGLQAATVTSDSRTAKISPQSATADAVALLVPKVGADAEADAPTVTQQVSPLSSLNDKHRIAESLHNLYQSSAGGIASADIQDLARADEATLWAVTAEQTAESGRDQRLLIVDLEGKIYLVHRGETRTIYGEAMFVTVTVAADGKSFELVSGDIGLTPAVTTGIAVANDVNEAGAVSQSLKGTTTQASLVTPLVGWTANLTVVAPITAVSVLTISIAALSLLGLTRTSRLRPRCLSAI
jgi:hypothetical protein